MGEFDKAIEEYLLVSREYKDTSFRMSAVLRVGDVFYRQKKYERAVSYYQRSIKVPSELWWPKESFENYARAEYMIGVCYFEQNALNRAFTQFRRFVQRYSTSPLVDRAYDFIGRGIDNVELRLFVIDRQDPLAVRRQRDTLRAIWHRNAADHNPRL